MASLVSRLLLRGLIVLKLRIENREVEWIRTEHCKPEVVGGCDSGITMLVMLESGWCWLPEWVG